MSEWTVFPTGNTSGLEVRALDPKFHKWCRLPRWLVTLSWLTKLRSPITYAIAVCLLIVGEPVPAADQFSDVDYYVYLKYREPGGKNLLPCPPIPLGATPAAGEYLFQIVFVPSEEASELPPFELLPGVWGTLRAELESRLSGEGTRRILAVDPMVDPRLNSRPEDTRKPRYDENLWGYDNSILSNTWTDSARRWLGRLIGTSGGAKRAEDRDDDVALLQILCGEEPEIVDGSGAYTLHRLHRRLEARTSDFAGPAAFAAIRRFFDPRASETSLPTLEALSQAVEEDTAFRRASYLNGKPSLRHKELYEQFRSDLNSLSTSLEESQRLAKRETREVVGDREREARNHFSGQEIEPAAGRFEVKLSERLSALEAKLSAEAKDRNADHNDLEQLTDRFDELEQAILTNTGLPILVAMALVVTTVTLLFLLWRRSSKKHQQLVGKAVSGVEDRIREKIELVHQQLEAPLKNLHNQTLELETLIKRIEAVESRDPEAIATAVFERLLQERMSASGLVAMLENALRPIEKRIDELAKKQSADADERFPKK